MMLNSRLERSLKVSVLGAWTIAGLLAFGVGGWAATSRLSGAVIAQGSVVVEGFTKKVQHPTGGLIGEILVQDGMEVHAGDTLLRLDETIPRASHAIISKGIDELLARRARLLAEQNATPMVFPAELTDRSSDPEVGRLMSSETRLFEIRAEARKGQSAQLRQRVDQLREQIFGLEEQLRAKGEEIQIIARELAGVRELWDKKLIQISRVTTVERDSARLIGEKGALIGSIAQAKGHITEIELQIAQVEQDLRSEAGKELADIRGKLSESEERRIAAADQLNRTDLRAPLDGIVHQLSVHTVGGVVSPGETVMIIVPKAQRLAVEARLLPQDIDHIRIGAPVKLRFSAFNQRTTPEIEATVVYVSADTTLDTKTDAPFYIVRAVPSFNAIERNAMVLLPGMPVEAFFSTGDRSILSFLMKPLADQLQRTWRER